jgi:hypothetical protein
VHAAAFAQVIAHFGWKRVGVLLNADDFVLPGNKGSGAQSGSCNAAFVTELQTLLNNRTTVILPNVDNASLVSAGYLSATTQSQSSCSSVTDMSYLQSDMSIPLLRLFVRALKARRVLVLAAMVSNPTTAARLASALYALICDPG